MAKSCRLALPATKARRVVRGSARFIGQSVKNHVLADDDVVEIKTQIRLMNFYYPASVPKLQKVRGVVPLPQPGPAACVPSTQPKTTALFPV